jgi:hypothetical protein
MSAQAGNDTFRAEIRRQTAFARAVYGKYEGNYARGFGFVT